MIFRGVIGTLLCLVIVVNAHLTDPHRLSSEKMDALKTISLQKTETASVPAAIPIPDDAPLPEYEITSDGIKEVKTISPANVLLPKKSEYYSSLEELVLLSVSEKLTSRRASGSDEGENELLDEDASEQDAATNQKIKTDAEPTPNTSPSPTSKPSSQQVPPTPTISSPPAARPPSKAPANNGDASLPPFAPKVQSSLQCSCTFMPLPVKLPNPLTPEQKRPDAAAAVNEKLREKKILESITKRQLEQEKKKAAAAKKAEEAKKKAKEEAKKKAEEDAKKKSDADKKPALIATASTATPTLPAQPTQQPPSPTEEDPFYESND